MIKNIRKSIIDTLIWLGLFLIFLNLSNYWQPIRFAFYSALFETLSLLIVYRLTVSFLFPKYYTNQKQYLWISLSLITLLSLIYTSLDIYTIPRLIDESYSKPPLIFILIRYIITNGFTFFIATYFRLMEHTNRLRENEKLLTEEKLKTELKLLKAQINPHFIFNALNNIYSLTYMKAKNAPESVLKLSEMLRYVFYDCSKERVKISSELKYIENFIGFQQMKTENPQNIKLISNLNDGTAEIAPMLFIPFIENAFKYSRIEESDDGFVDINIVSKNKSILLSIENSMDTLNKPMSGSGTGIKNVQHRLDIIYPQKYRLNITEVHNKYRVELNIES